MSDTLAVMARFTDDLTTVDTSDGIAEAKCRIMKRLAAMGVLEDLSDAQEQQITDKVFSTTRTLQVFRNRAQEPNPPVGFSSRELRRLDTRVRRLRRAFEDLAMEGARLGPEDDFWSWIGGDYVTEVLDELEGRIGDLPGPADMRRDPSSTLSIQDIRSNFCSIPLLLTFVVCGIPLGPASWRVAKIENIFWEGNIQETDGGTDRKRSSAILKRLYRPHKPR